jgi:outer membrane protein OmpA-like peptidoglycan-associated protein
MKKAQAWIATAAVGTSLAFVVGCGGDAKPEPKTATTEHISTTQPTSAAVPNKKSDQTINVSDEIRKACGIDDSDRAPKFDFDSSQLSSNDRDILAQIAKCLTTGPLKGRSVELTGRTDPRGESEYNMNLGASRAKSADDYMAGLGVAANQMSLTSRGALDATGHDEETWRHDRRVDVNLIKQ